MNVSGQLPNFFQEHIGVAAGDKHAVRAAGGYFVGQFFAPGSSTGLMDKRDFNNFRVKGKITGERFLIQLLLQPSGAGADSHKQGNRFPGDIPVECAVNVCCSIFRFFNRTGF